MLWTPREDPPNFPGESFGFGGMYRGTFVPVLGVLLSGFAGLFFVFGGVFAGFPSDEELFNELEGVFDESVELVDACVESFGCFPAKSCLTAG